MTEVVLTRGDDGKLTGLGEKDKRAWARFKKLVFGMDLGEIVRLSYWFPRNPKFHRLHMVTLSNVHDQQEQFEDFDIFRGWVYVGAGECVVAPGPSGRMVAIPKSVRYDKIDDEDFKTLHDGCMQFLRSAHATNFLWPHLSAADQAEMINVLLGNA